MIPRCPGCRTRRCRRSPSDQSSMRTRSAPRMRLRHDCFLSSNLWRADLRFPASTASGKSNGMQNVSRRQSGRFSTTVRSDFSIPLRRLVDVERKLGLPSPLAPVTERDVPLQAAIGVAGLDQFSAFGRWVAQLVAQLLKGLVLGAAPLANVSEVEI